MKEDVIYCGRCDSASMRLSLSPDGKELIAECTECSAPTAHALDDTGLRVSNAKVQLNIKFPLDKVMITDSILNDQSRNLNAKSTGNYFRVSDD